MDGKMIVGKWLEYHDWADHVPGGQRADLIRAIDAALAQARAEERDACAKIAGQYADDGMAASVVARLIMEQIKARTP